jgi:phosphate transport system protein
MDPFMKHLEQDLERLHRDVLRLAAAVEEAIAVAVTALANRNRNLANEVIEGDADINDLSTSIEEKCINCLALHQPVAHHLRRITTVSTINNDLERMADLAVSIAERALTVIDGVLIPIPGRLRDLADTAIAMVHQSLDAFVTLDAEAARAVIARDDEADRLNDSIIAELVAMMKRSPASIEPALSLFTIVRRLERIADHATHVAENVVFLIEGKPIRRQPIAADAS